jgi:thiamine-monophosphate kinase
VANARERTLDPDTIVPWLASALPRRGWLGLLAGVAEDDCGVVQLGRTLAVLSADFLNATPIVEQLGLGGERILGRLAVAATLADLLGSGAVPRALLVGVTVPHGYPEHLFKELMLGARSESNRWNVPILGGDTKLGHARAVLTCGLGTADSPKQLFLASQARAGDAILASGCLGTCAAATYVATRNGTKGTVPRWALRAIRVPQLPAVRSRALAKLEVAHGGIDISDGLAADLRRLGNASDVGAVLEVDNIPIDRPVVALARRENVPPWAFSLASGGDFQFIVTVPQAMCAKAEALGFTKIGRVTRQRGFWLTDRTGKICYRLPEVGHKDRRGQKFGDEIRRIVLQTTRGHKQA